MVKTKITEFLAQSTLSDAQRAMVLSLTSEDLPCEEDLTRRLALPRTFTKRLFAVVTAGLESPPAFEKFIDCAPVDPLVPEPDRFVIRESAREACFSGYWAVHVSECREWAGRIAEAMDRSDEIESFDRLQLLFLADQSQARREWAEAVAAADKAGNLAGYAALVELVAPVLRRFGDEDSRRKWQQVKAHQQARVLFYAEYYQTKVYSPRRDLEAAFRGFLNSSIDTRWIFHLFATGGMGKTTLMRRIISHDLVTKEYPCAWLDFDFLEISSVLEAPWLLLLPLAAQWNEQLVQPVFGSLLDTTFLPYASLLFRTQSDGSASGFGDPKFDRMVRAQYAVGRSNPMRCGVLANVIPPASTDERRNLLSSARNMEAMVIQKFVESMTAMPSDRPILLFVDTLEEASGTQETEFLELLKIFRELRQRALEAAKLQGCPPVNFKLILSGRFQLGKEHVPAFRTEFAHQYQEARLGGFSAEEATAFLEERLQSRSNPLIRAMVKRAMGIPFHISLFADWAKADPALTPETILQDDRIDAVMLIERVIKRISYQPLRWIIRYGVVPRKLSKEFLEEVMKQPLVDALNGAARTSGVDVAESALEKDVWVKEPGFHFDAEELWNRHVQTYVSGRGWLMPDDGAVRFRTDITNPMRRLLRSQEIFGILHRKARDWFSSLLHAEPDHVEAWVEFVYHSLQLHLAGNRESRWDSLVREVFDSPGLLAKPARRREIARQLRTSDFAELPTPARAWIEFEYAVAIAEAGGYRYLEPEARVPLETARELAGQSEVTLPRFTELWSAAFRRTPVSALLPMLGSLQGDEQVAGGLIIAELGEANSPLIVDILQGALRIHREWAVSRIPRAVVEERVARGLLLTDPEQAAAHFIGGAHDFHRRGDRAGTSRMLFQAAVVESDLGRLARAEALLRQASQLESTERTLLETGRLELRKGQAEESLRALAGCKPENLGSDAVLEWHLLQAEALSELMLWRQANEAWQTASDLAQRSANDIARRRCALGQVRLDRWWLQRLDVQPFGLASETSGQPDPIYTDELAVWQIVSHYDPDAAARRAFGELNGNSPTGGFRLILALSQVVELAEHRWVDALQFVEQIPRSARYRALSEPVLMGNPPKLPEEIRQQLAAAMRYEPEGEIERAWYGIRLGEFLAWLRLDEAAANTLRAFLPTTAESEIGWRATALRERRRIEQRLRDWGAEIGPEQPDPPDFWLSLWSDTPLRAAAASIENARWAFQVGDHGGLADILQRVRPILEECPIPTAFHRWAHLLGEALDEFSPRARNQTFGAGDRIDPRRADLPDDCLVVAMRPDSAGLMVELSGVELSGVQLATMRLSADSSVLNVLLRSSRSIPRRLVSMDVSDLASEFGGILKQAKVPFFGPLRTCLRVPLGPLSAVPWEIAFRDVRVLLWRGASPSQSPEGQPRIFSRPLEAPRGECRHAILYAATSRDLESEGAWAYNELRESPLVVESVEEYARSAADSPILHVVGSFSEHSSQDEPVLANLRLSASIFARFLGEVTRKPAIFLDVPPVSHATDRMHQVFLRNYFAQSLLNSGMVRCVVATGLVPPDFLPEYHRLLDHMARRPSIPQINFFDLLNQMSEHFTEQRFHALFTRDPQEPLEGY